MPGLVGEVEVERRDGDAAVGDGGEVGALLVLVAGLLAVDPVAAPAVVAPRSAPCGRGRCACRAGRRARPGASPAGQFTLSSVPSGIGTSVELLDHAGDEGGHLLEVVAAPSRAPTRKSSSPRSACWETAIAGMPSTIPSSAAATVPE